MFSFCALAFGGGGGAWGGEKIEIRLKEQVLKKNIQARITEHFKKYLQGGQERSLENWLEKKKKKKEWRHNRKFKKIRIFHSYLFAHTD